MKKNLNVILACVVVTAVLFTACGSGAGRAKDTAKEEQTVSGEEAAEVTEETEEAAAETGKTSEAEAPAAAAAAEGGKTSEAEEPAAEAAAETLKTYADAKGWSVKYDPEKITVNELEDGADFVYTGDSAGTNMITIRCIPDKQPEELLYEVTSEWGTDDSIQDKITRTEGFLPGTTDKWGFCRILNMSEEGSAMTRAAMAGEYNGEVLLFDITAHMTTEDPTDYVVNDEMTEFTNSIAYENFEPQTMFEYVPGTYAREESEKTDGQDAVDGKYTITLRADHTGTLSLQDSVDIIWGSAKLTASDGGSEYEYTIEGDSLMLNLDGEWISFQKQEAEPAVQ